MLADAIERWHLLETVEGYSVNSLLYKIIRAPLILMSVALIKYVHNTKHSMRRSVRYSPADWCQCASKNTGSADRSVDSSQDRTGENGVHVAGNPLLHTSPQASRVLINAA